MELELITSLTELRPFELSHFRQFFFALQGIEFQILLQFCMDATQTSQPRCEHIEDERVDRINLMAFVLINFGQCFCTIYRVCVISSSYSFQLIHFKLCTRV